MRGKALDIPVLLGSATPSLESLHNAHSGRYTHLRLSQRAGDAKPPSVRVTDIRKRPVTAGLSADTMAAIASALQDGGQVLAVSYTHLDVYKRQVPMGTIIGSHSKAVPMVTAAKVCVPWWPAMTLSTKPIKPVETWPSTSGKASVAVARTSLPKRGVGEVVEDMEDCLLYTSRCV